MSANANEACCVREASMLILIIVTCTIVSVIASVSVTYILLKKRWNIVSNPQQNAQIRNRQPKESFDYRVTSAQTQCVRMPTPKGRTFGTHNTAENNPRMLEPDEMDSNKHGYRNQNFTPDEEKIFESAYEDHEGQHSTLQSYDGKVNADNYDDVVVPSTNEATKMSRFRQYFNFSKNKSPPPIPAREKNEQNLRPTSPLPEVTAHCQTQASPRNHVYDVELPPSLSSGR